MKKMKHLRVRTVIHLSLVLFFLTWVSASAADRVEVPLTNPAKPVVLKAKVLSGSIMVKGTSAKQVIVEAAVRKSEKKEVAEPDDKAKGMKLIQTSGTGLEVEEDNNEVNIRTRSWSNAVDLTIQVPRAASLHLHATNNGKIVVEKVSGDMEISNVNGPITMTAVAGTVVAHSVNGVVTIAFDSINLEKPMSFSTLNGDIDVTFPKNLKANVKLNTSHGNIYSDFEIAMKQGPGKVMKKSNEGGKFKVTFDKTLYGAINGGGEEYTFKTFNGNIYIRAKK